MSEAEGDTAAAVVARPVRVFISYAHDSPEHAEAVRGLWVLLRAYGIDAKLDRVAAQQRQDWALWMADQVREADHILVIASPAYKLRAEDRAGPDEGRGVQWEARLIRDAFYRDQRALDRFVPVVLPGGTSDDLPDFLAPASSTVYQVAAFTRSGAETLLRLLTSQASEVEPILGQVPPFGVRGHAAEASPSVLRHDLTVQIEPTTQGNLRTRTSLAGTLLGERTAPAPSGVRYCWDGFDSRPRWTVRQRWGRRCGRRCSTRPPPLTCWN